MTTTILLKRLQFQAYHGVSPQERRVGNTYFVDLSLTAPLGAAVDGDQLTDTINYADVYALVKAEMQIPSSLIEHAAGRILRGLKAHYPAISFIRVSLEKLNPPLGGDIHSAAIILEETYS